MSLFPAYQNANLPTQKPQEINTDGSELWLQNSSYQITLPTTQITDGKCPTTAHTKTQKTTERDDDSTSSSSSSSTHAHRKKRKKHAKKSKKTRDEKRKHQTSLSALKDIEKSSDFYEIDRRGHREYLTVKTISRPSVSKYSYSRRLTLDPNPLRRRNKNRKTKRFYAQNLEVQETEAQTLTTSKAEQDITSKTSKFSQALRDDPQNVQQWLEYIDFQDVVFDFEKLFKKGSQAKGARVTADRKLSILEKALTHNPSSETLFRKRLQTAEGAFLADELTTYLKALVEKEPSNIIYWQGYIESVQCSMSHCNTEAVLKLYNKCLSTLHQLRRNSVLEKPVLETNILRILYQCGLFLKQAGLWEQLCTLLRLYLELNLNCAQAQFKSPTPDVEDYEEAVLGSKLPIHELWLRLERLRESCHWLPWSGGSAPCEDPQRLVFAEDVSDFIHPITTEGNSFKLVVIVMALLKVPVVPCRHGTTREFGLDYVPWAFDGVETVMVAFYNVFPVVLDVATLLNDVRGLTTGPQYLKKQPGQEEYLDFVQATLKTCAGCLQGAEQTAVLVWWFRFNRLLHALELTNKKRLKSEVKALIKTEQHRNNLLLYVEYAQLEQDLEGGIAALQILKTALSSVKHGFVPQIADKVLRTNLCYLYRVMTETYLKMRMEKEALQTLACLATAKLEGPNLSKETDNLEEPNLSKETNKLEGPNPVLTEASLVFKRTSLVLLSESRGGAPLALHDHFLPDFTTDFLICYGWFLYLTKGPLEAALFCENLLSSTPDLHPLRREILSEFYAAVMFKSCTERLGTGLHRILTQTLQKTLSEFPGNVFLLTIAARVESFNVCKWKLTNSLLKSGHALPVLFVVLCEVAKLQKLHEDVEASVKNRVKALLQRITRSDICTKRCGLIWRLYLKFLYTHCKLIDCRKAYYAAVEECPWLKALYIDAAIYIPAELAPIQDLIIEKQLRLHITPEELDILRS